MKNVSMPSRASTSLLLVNLVENCSSIGEVSMPSRASTSLLLLTGRSATAL